MAEIKKITKKDNFIALREICEKQNRDDLIAFIDHELEQLAKKSSANKPETENQKNNSTIKEIILETLESLGKGTITEIQEANDLLSGYSNQKLNALFKQLREEGKINRTLEKRKAYFTLS